MADRVSIKFSTELSLVRRKLTNVGDKLRGQLEQELRVIAEETAEDLRQTTPGKGGFPTAEWKSTGKLAEGWKAVPLPGTKAASRWGVTNTDPRAYTPARGHDKSLLDILEYGTTAHVIVHKEAPELRFFWKKLGRWEKRQSVKHPGTKPYGFIRAATARAKAKQAAASRRLAQAARQAFA